MFIPNKIIVSMLNYLISDLFCIEYNNFGMVVERVYEDPFHPINVINNVRLTSKNFKLLFELFFNKTFAVNFKIDLELVAENDFWKNVIHGSVLGLHVLNGQNYYKKKNGSQELTN